MNLRVRSITDIITNSSSTAYCFKIDKTFEELKQFMRNSGALYPDTFLEIRTLDDIKNLVFSGEYDYWNWSEVDIGDVPPEPIDDVFGNKSEVIRLLGESKTRDEIWDLLKHNYEPVVGYAFAELNNNSCEGSTDEMHAIDNFFSKKSQEVRMKFYSKLIPGKIYAMHIRDDRKLCCGHHLWDLYPEDFIMLYSGGIGFSKVYNPGYMPERNYIEDGKYRNGSDSLWGCVDLETLRESTQEEIGVFNDHLRKAGFSYNGDGEVYELKST